MREYRITFDEVDQIYVARCLTGNLQWLTGHGSSPEAARQMAEENLASLRCPDCGFAPGERGE